jgi:DNA topoisomerase IB
MAAIAARRHVLAMAFLGDAREVRVGAFQLTFRRAGYPLQGRHDFRMDLHDFVEFVS